MTNEAPVVLTVTRRYKASAERVFDAWLDPEKARHFLFATPGGDLTRFEIDPRVGGSFVIVDRRDGEDAAHYGEYLEIERPRRLVFKYSMEREGDRTRVTIDIAASPDGCELTLTHELPPRWAAYRDSALDGWNAIFDNLAATIEDAPG